jgi:Lon protease-like protein
VLGLPGRVMLPGSRCCVALTSVSSFGAVREATRAWGAPVLAVFSASSLDGEGDPLSTAGVLVTVIDLRKQRDLWTAELRATRRVRKREVLRVHPFRVARVDPWPGASQDPDAVSALASAVQVAVSGARVRFHCLSSTVREQLRTAQPWELPGLVMPLVADVAWTDWQAVLEADALEDQLAFVLAHLHADRAAPGG